MYSIQLFQHQEAVINSVRYHPEIPYIFLIGGYGCGKSSTDVALCLFLYHAYRDSEEPVTIGVYGVTIKLLKQTVIRDIKSALKRGGISYVDNKQSGTLTVGNVTFVYLAMQDPGDIYAFNFNAVICDEIDEVPAERVHEIVSAIQERARVMMPNGHDLKRREPFICFTTTAQGMGGTYQLIQYLREKKLPYIKIRGRTQDNTTLAPSQIKLLRGLYTEDEARAYLDGEFINLAQGRCYPEFNMSKHVYMPFAIKPGVIKTQDDKIIYEGGDIIYAGQDFNPGFNTTICMIERGGNIFVISEDQFGYVGHVPQQLRERYPNNKIVLIPDASGKEIMSGFSDELTQYNIEVFWNSINPSIAERELAVNRLLMFNKLFIFSGCRKIINCLQLRDFDDTGKPRKGRGPDALDHPGDSLEYGIWRIVHSIKGYDKILNAIKAVYHHDEFLKEVS